MSERALRAVLVVVAAYHVVTGALALVAPDTFFSLIGHYGGENSHYVGDVGAFILAYGLLVGVTVVKPSWRAPVLWLGAAWYGLHAINHAFDTGEARSQARGWSDTILIGLGAVLAAWLARASERLTSDTDAIGGER
jgi:hypothetical protein